jgi:hypothetical protein
VNDGVLFLNSVLHDRDIADRAKQPCAPGMGLDGFIAVRDIQKCNFSAARNK